jgi:hypothetical protein
MERILDLNSVKRPTLVLTLMDDDRTVLHVKTPTEDMVSELQSMQDDLRKLETGDRNAVAMIYDLAARLLSCNRDYIRITAEDLRKKYRVDLESLILVYSAYLEFINGLANEKN